MGLWRHWCGAGPVQFSCQLCEWSWGRCLNDFGSWCSDGSCRLVRALFEWVRSWCSLVEYVGLLGQCLNEMWPRCSDGTCRLEEMACEWTWWLCSDPTAPPVSAATQYDSGNAGMLHGRHQAPPLAPSPPSLSQPLSLLPDFSITLSSYCTYNTCWYIKGSQSRCERIPCTYTGMCFCVQVWMCVRIPVSSCLQMGRVLLPPPPPFLPLTVSFLTYVVDVVEKYKYILACCFFPCRKTSTKCVCRSCPCYQWNAWKKGLRFSNLMGRVFRIWNLLLGWMRHLLGEGEPERVKSCSTAWRWSSHPLGNETGSLVIFNICKQ